MGDLIRQASYLSNMRMECLSIFAVIFFVGLCNSSLLRKKRQIMDAINALTEAALLAERMEEIQKKKKIQKEEAVPKHDGQGNMLRCRAAINSQCEGKGGKVALTCESGVVDVKSSSVDAAIVEVTCGSVASSEVDSGKALEMEKVLNRRRRQSPNNALFQHSEGFENVHRNNPGFFGNVQQCQGGR